ncbi:MAG: cell division protein FtsZ [Candidatus Micrarchaeota archaeon]|nr:cell division protein FtsZ [Candidatus Micrarchaeota archaeon]MDE1804827.1 cell division protein FtsZ [Candidatus Micrarchaeota archaeon]MDE1847150.1 cell division protein FtsZ [Candidatus Micrarchaeota archaeon]
MATFDSQFDYNAFTPRIAVVGLGGQGSNLVNRLYNAGIKSAETIAINTDVGHLNIINAHKKHLLGKAITKGLGAGGYPEVAAKCVEADKGEIEKLLEGYDLVFLCGGMGGGTGTGSAPGVARIAKENGATVIAMVTYPFALERSRAQKAQWGIDELNKNADTTIVVENDLLLKYAPNLQIEKAFEVADNITLNAVKGIADSIMLPSLINLDFADLRNVVGRTGTAVISVGTGNGSDRVQRAIKDTRAHPLLSVEYEGAKGGFVHVTGGTNLTIGDATAIGNGVTEGLADDANVIFGARLSPELNDQVRVMSVITGVKAKFSSGRNRDAERAPMLKMDELETF